MNYAYLPKVIINLLLPVRFLQHLKISVPEASARIITWPLTYTVHIYSLLVIMYKHCALAGLEDDIPWMLITSLLWVLLLTDSWWYVGFLKIWSILKLYFAPHKALIVLQFFAELSASGCFLLKMKLNLQDPWEEKKAEQNGGGSVSVPLIKFLDKIFVLGLFWVKAEVSFDVKMYNTDIRTF